MGSNKKAKRALRWALARILIVIQAAIRWVILFIIY